MVEVNIAPLSNTFEENRMTKEELLHELALLRTQLAHTTEEKDLIKKKVKISDESASQLAKKYAEFTKE